MHIRLIAVLLLHLISINVQAASKSDSEQLVEVAAPYLDLHSGSGSGYPIFHVIERGELVEIIQRRSQWFKVKSQKGIEGWVHFDQISQTVAPNGDAIEFSQVTQDDFIERNWEVGVLGGEFGGSPLFSVYSAYLFNPGFATEFSYSKSIADKSSSTYYKLGVFMQPFPELEYSPYFHLGTGTIKSVPITISPQSTQRAQFANLSFGIRTHVSRQVILRLEYSNYVILNATTIDDDNEEVREWKAGFAVFF